MPPTVPVDGAIGDQQLKPADLLTARAGAVGIHADRDLVRHGLLGVADAAFEQVDDLLVAGVLQLLEARDGDRDRGLLPVELGRRESRPRS